MFSSFASMSTCLSYPFFFPSRTIFFESSNNSYYCITNFKLQLNNQTYNWSEFYRRKYRNIFIYQHAWIGDPDRNNASSITLFILHIREINSSRNGHNYERMYAYGDTDKSKKRSVEQLCTVSPIEICSYARDSTKS